MDVRFELTTSSSSRSFENAILLLLLFSYQLMATVQSVVTGQAPITLERKITSGGKQIETQDNTKITETNRIPQTKIKR